jgi:hypothetical protein
LSILSFCKFVDCDFAFKIDNDAFGFLEVSLFVFLNHKLKVFDIFKADIELLSRPIVLSTNDLNRRVKPINFQTQMFGINWVLNILNFFDENLFLNRPLYSIKTINRESLPDDFFALFSNVGGFNSDYFVVRKNKRNRMDFFNVFAGRMAVFDDFGFRSEFSRSDLNEILINPRKW